MSSLEKSPFCIYVVDDDEEDQLLIKTVFAAYSDCAVTFFSNGEDLLVDLLDCPPGSLPALILLDLDMPRLDGYAVLTAIQANPALKRIHVLVLSGAESVQSVQRAYALGANAFMNKPNTYEALNQLLQATYAYWLQLAKIPGTS